MALHLHRAERTDLLADGLGALLADPLPDPFAEELVLVPARGVERWLSQRLSHVLGESRGSDGVCAGVAFRSPASLIAEITGTVEDDPWSPDALAWPVLEVIDCSLDQPWCRSLATHLGHFDTGPEAELRRGRRYSVARRLAGLFASYARQRPRLLADWLDGDASGLDGDLAWEPELWRAVAARVAADPPHIRHRDTIARLLAGPTELPARLSLFGHTRLAHTDVELLSALSAHHDLHLWLPHPSDDLWRELAGVHGAVPRSEDRSRFAAHHPLLQTLGRDLRELQRSLPVERATDEYLGRDRATPNTLLGWLQSDIAANAVRPAGRELAPGDRSVQVHSCHGAARQIDVLREVLLGLLEDDPTLEPRDIVVMCPDVEAYAPLIVTGFGLGELASESHPAHRLRVRLADRSPAQTNPLLGVAEELLGIAGSRATATAVLNLARAAPVRARFAFTDDDLESITEWVRDSGIRWGFDKEHRAPYGLDHILHNTWRFGLDRLLTGAAMSDDSQAWVGTALPLDDVGSNKVELAGRFAEYVDRLRGAVDSLDGSRPLAEWVEALTRGVAELTRVGADDAWQSGQLCREFAKVLEDAGSRALTVMRLSDVRALLAGRLAGRPTRANFRTGTLTVCTMVPMRSVPHRVVCLVGVDDGVFPRYNRPDGDDALARAPMTGERDIRSEDRQLLLDAICAATETLVITYSGADEHTGHHRPPAVPLSEVLDALDQTTSSPVRNRVVVRHPLQPFDIRNVTPGELVPGQPFTFDPTALVAARAAAGDRRPTRPFFADPLPEQPPDDVSLPDLMAFFKDPVKGFFRALDYVLPWDVEDLDDEMPVEIDSLQEWTVGDRMLRDMLRGMHPDTAANAEWRRGTLPPGRLGMRKAVEIRDQAAGLARAALRHRRGDAGTYDVDVDLGAGRRLTGTVTPVFGERTVSVTYSKLGGRHLMESWIRLLALSAAVPGREWASLCIGRGRTAHRIEERLLGPPPHPLQAVRDLVRLYDAGRREPLPLPVRTSFAWAEARHNGRDPVRAAGWRWNSQNNFHGENAEPAHEKLWGRRAPLTALLGAPHLGEEVAGEDTRMGALAARLWLPLLRSEVR
ncbi:exodeoxyribonuclease V subunit RecC [Mycobacterium bohemicum DSM 44277]|uniref:RecBCD enzyme subunit RecC n=2 Tax=Mycobacterium bohemicum TaxID=56425 RepID=A0A1X1RBW5_MYCBE|nr:exodeoxyribonuclease V subunit gamma [Mycobacterium bohemicum]MCV6968287.1 exodeoxyribonuclease V subunit gamma [Mycobacterium bohemicum]ORV02832.1 exodeoxyribonuclease V subunit gamma [Mycobacterium bohemicum]CPR11848.1 exodeoxyribonuclease V subunit RecC [Mycobacterium bohemicum DSM 44277]